MGGAVKRAALALVVILAACVVLVVPELVAWLLSEDPT